MESAVVGKVIAAAGAVGDQVPIGAVLAVIETEGADRGAEPVEDSNEERPLGDGAVGGRPEKAEEIPGSEFVLLADTVVKAIGQRPRNEFLQLIEGLEVVPNDCPEIQERAAAKTSLMPAGQATRDALGEALGGVGIHGH